MQPVWQSFVKGYHGPLRLVYVDVDKLESPQYKAYAPLWEADRQMPQVCLVERGKLRARLPGLLTQQQLDDLTSSYRRGGGSSSTRLLPGEKPR